VAAHISGDNMFQRFLHSQVVSAFILIGATAIALIWANSQWGQFYCDLAYTDETFIDQVKVGNLFATIVAGVLGALVLHFTLPKRAD